MSHDTIKQVAHATIIEYVRAYPAMPSTSVSDSGRGDGTAVGKSAG